MTLRCTHCSTLFEANAALYTAIGKPLPAQCSACRFTARYRPAPPVPPRPPQVRTKAKTPHGSPWTVPLVYAALATWMTAHNEVPMKAELREYPELPSGNVVYKTCGSLLQVYTYLDRHGYPGCLARYQERLRRAHASAIAMPWLANGTTSGRGQHGA